MIFALLTIEALVAAVLAVWVWQRGESMTKARFLGGCLALTLHLFITLPAWLWLLYGLLVRTNASPLEWFIFVAYVPASIFAAIIGGIIQAAGTD